MRWRRSVIVGAVAATMVLTSLLATPSAEAATNGLLAVSSPSGSAMSISIFYTSGTCSDPLDQIKVSVSGGSGVGVLTGSVIYLNNTPATNQPTQGMGYAIDAPLSWRDWALTRAGVGGLQGTYTLYAFCSRSGDNFTGTVTFGGTPNLSTANTYSAPQPTTTVLIPPSASVQWSTPSSVTAHVAAVDGSTPTGSVQFGVDGVSYGAPVPIDAFGNALFTIPSTLTLSTHFIDGTYTPDAAGVANNFTSSVATPEVVTIVPLMPTITISDSVGGQAGQGATVKLTATVSPASVVGTVTFTVDSTVVVASGVTVNNGVATANWTVPSNFFIGNHTIFAHLAPTDPLRVMTPSPAGENFLVLPCQTCVAPVNGTVTLVLPAGTLAMTTPSNMTLSLGNPELAPNGTYFIASGTSSAVEVSDTRAGDFGWTVRVQTSPFVGTHGGTTFVPPARYPWQVNTINSYNLGYGSSILTAPPGETLNVGLALSDIAANQLGPSSLPPGATGSTGLGSGRVMVMAQGGIGLGSGTGDAIIGGQLVLHIPTITIADTYTSTLAYTLSSN